MIRGTANTLTYSCFDTTAERTLASYKYPDLTGDSSEFALGNLWANAGVLSNICYNKTKDTAALIGTAFVARDLMQVVDALQEDGLLRYWGNKMWSKSGCTMH
jgi:hypothetical protein